MLGFEFDNNSEPFTVYNIIQSVGCFVFQIIETYVDGNQNQIIYVSAIGVFAAISCGSIIFFKFRENKANLSIVDSLKGTAMQRGKSYPTPSFAEKASNSLLEG
jgi:hypothetical protein